MTDLGVPSATGEVRGACPHDCPDTCAWTVSVQDGRATALTGDPDHPFTAGGLCTKVNRFLDDRVYHPDRLLHPLKRSGPKGSGAYTEVSWDEALDDIARRLRSVIGDFGAESVLPYSYLGTQGLVQGSAVSDPFFARMGATELTRAVCGDAGIAGTELTMGSGVALLPEELRRSRFIILWGTNTLSTNLHLWPFVRGARDRGATVVVIDPVETRTSKAADWHVRPLPGTDAALALGMMNIIVNEDLIDREYIERHTVGFTELRERLADYSPDRVAALTGLDADEIVRLARAYATTPPAAIRLLVGLEHHQFGAETYRAIACLPALVGAWSERGGGLCHMTFRLFDGLDWSCGVGIAADSPRSVNMVQIGRALTDLDPPIRAFVVYNANPSAIAPEQNLVMQGLAREDLFTVVIDHVMTDTAAHADYVLPATTQVEHRDVMWSWGQTYLTWNEPAIEPVGEALPNAEIFRRLGQRLGYRDRAFSATDAELADSAIAPLGRARVAELKERGWIRMEEERHLLPFASGGFGTPSGKAEFFSQAEMDAGRDPLPAYRAASEGPHGDPEQLAKYPLQLMSAKGAHHFLNSGYVHVDRAVRAERGQFVDMNSADAAGRRVTEGADVRVFNDRGSLIMPARVGTRVPPGVVSVPSGWWASACPAGRSVNALTSDGLSDLGQGGDFHDTLVQVELA